MRENTEKYITFLVPIDNNEEIYWFKFVDSFGIMKRSLPELVDNLTEIQNVKWSYRHDNKRYKICDTKYRSCKGYLEYEEIKDSKLIYSCSFYNRNYQRELNNDPIKTFQNTYKFHFGKDIMKQLYHPNKNSSVI